jgi:hypothetical protein
MKSVSNLKPLNQRSDLKFFVSYKWRKDAKEIETRYDEMLGAFF